MLVCDHCLEQADGTATIAECEDDCSLELDHDGLCASPLRQVASTQVFCDHCGQQERLHDVEDAITGECPLCRTKLRVTIPGVLSCPSGHGTWYGLHP